MITDALPPNANYGVWDVFVEYTDMEDNTLIDFTTYPNIVLEIIDPWSSGVVMSLSRGNGVITTPAPGIIAWYVPKGQMLGLRPGTYKVRMRAWKDDETQTLPLMESSVSIVGD